MHNKYSEKKQTLKTNTSLKNNFKKEARKMEVIFLLLIRFLKIFTKY